MSEKESTREDSTAPVPSSTPENAAKAVPATEDLSRRQPEQFHGRMLELFKQSVAAEGEVALKRWGMHLFHSLSDEEAEAQRKTLGFTLTDSLDFYNQGCLLAGQEDFAGAAKAFEKAAQLDPTLAEAVFNRALALEQAGDAAAARATWKSFLERFGESEDAEEVKKHLESLAAA